MKRLLIGLIATLVVLTGAPFAYAASKTATVKVSPQTGQVTVDGTLAIDLVLDTGGQAVGGVDVTVKYSSNLEYVSGSIADSAFPNQVTAPSNSNGAVSFSSVRLDTGYNGSSGKLIGLVFKPKSAGTSTITLDDPSTIVTAYSDSTNIYNGAANGTYTIAAASTGGSAPAASPSAAASPKATTSSKATASPKTTASAAANVKASPAASPSVSTAGLTTPTPAASDSPAAEISPSVSDEGTPLISKIGSSPSPLDSGEPFLLAATTGLWNNRFMALPIFILLLLLILFLIYADRKRRIKEHQEEQRVLQNPQPSPVASSSSATAQAATVLNLATTAFSGESAPKISETPSSAPLPPPPPPAEPNPASPETNGKLDLPPTFGTPPSQPPTP